MASGSDPTLQRRRRRALAVRKTQLRAIDAAAQTGERAQPNRGRKRPAAAGRAKRL